MAYIDDGGNMGNRITCRQPLSKPTRKVKKPCRYSIFARPVTECASSKSGAMASRSKTGAPAAEARMITKVMWVRSPNGKSRSVRTHYKGPGRYLCLNHDDGLVLWPWSDWLSQSSLKNQTSIYLT